MAPGQKEMLLSEHGDYLAGIAAPVAFLWLVLGYRQQGKELRLQRREFTRMVCAMNQGREFTLAEKTLPDYLELQKRTTYGLPNIRDKVVGACATVIRQRFDFNSDGATSYVSSLYIREWEQERPKSELIFGRQYEPTFAILVDNLNELERSFTAELRKQTIDAGKKPQELITPKSLKTSVKFSADVDHAIREMYEEPYRAKIHAETTRRIAMLDLPPER